MTAQGSNVDAVNWAAHYTLVGRTADHHHTFCSPFNPMWPSKQLCKIYGHENKLRSISVGYSMAHKHDSCSPGSLSVNACKHGITDSEQEHNFQNESKKIQIRKNSLVYLVQY